MQPIITPDNQNIRAATGPSEPRQPSGQSAEQLPVQEKQVVSAAETAPPTPQGQPVAVPMAQAPSQPAVAASSTPAAPANTPKHADLQTAGGDDIEKEWVDRADAIIQQYSNDPYAEDMEHEDLSAAYLKKRFGLEIKRSTDGAK